MAEQQAAGPGEGENPDDVAQDMVSALRRLADEIEVRAAKHQSREQPDPDRETVVHPTSGAGPLHSTRWIEAYRDGREVQVIKLGITFRDYLASQAMEALLTNPKYLDILLVDTQPQPFGMASFAYRIADAMLKAREPAPKSTD